MDGVLIMFEVLEYNKGKQELSVRWNTDTTWKYKGFTEKDYAKVLKSPSPGNCITNIVHKSFIVGTKEEVK